MLRIDKYPIQPASESTELGQSLSSINDFAATATLIGTNHGGLSTPEITKSLAIFIARDFVFSSWDDPFCELH